MKYIIYNLYLSYHFYYTNVTLVLRFLNCVVSMTTFQRDPSFSIFRSPFFFVVFHFFPQFSSFPVILVFRFPSVFFLDFSSVWKRRVLTITLPPRLAQGRLIGLACKRSLNLLAVAPFLKVCVHIVSLERRDDDYTRQSRAEYIQSMRKIELNYKKITLAFFFEKLMILFIV